MYKLFGILALATSTYACCGLSFTTCCQAYAPPRIIGYERIPLYARVPVQNPPLAPPSYAIAPGAPSPAVVPGPPIVIQDQGPVVMQNYANPVQTVAAQPVVQSVAQVPGNYGPGVISNNVPGIATNLVTDFNNVQVPTAKALKLRRSYLKQVKV